MRLKFRENRPRATQAVNPQACRYRNSMGILVRAYRVQPTAINPLNLDCNPSDIQNPSRPGSLTSPEGDRTRASSPTFLSAFHWIYQRLFLGISQGIGAIGRFNAPLSHI